MSEDEKPAVDEGELESAKSGLSKVETKTGSDEQPVPVFKCEECGDTQSIPDDILDKMEADEDITGDIPDHCGETMKISVTKA